MKVFTILINHSTTHQNSKENKVKAKEWLEHTHSNEINRHSVYIVRHYIGVSRVGVAGVIALNLQKSCFFWSILDALF